MRLQPRYTPLPSAACAHVTCQNHVASLHIAARNVRYGDEIVRGMCWGTAHASTDPNDRLSCTGLRVRPATEREGGPGGHRDHKRQRAACDGSCSTSDRTIFVNFESYAETIGEDASRERRSPPFAFRPLHCARLQCASLACAPLSTRTLVWHRSLILLQLEPSDSEDTPERRISRSF